MRQSGAAAPPTAPLPPARRSCVSRKARQSSSEPWVGLNCAGCHSTDISYRGSELTVDAGATLANVQAIFDEVLAALRRTSDDGDKFARFAGNVLGSEDSPANRDLLKAALAKRAALIDTLLSMSATDLQPGPGRLDATGQSLNRAAINSGARHLQANPTDAPTSFPALWHTLQMDKLQSSGFVPNVKVLDLNGQVFDLGYLAGDIGVVQGDYGDVVSHPLSGLEGYISSIRVDNLTRVEGLIHKLKAPAWPSQLFGAPDSARLAQGKRLYEENCAACHASIGRDDLQTPIKVRQVRLKAHGDDAPIGTDPWMACNTFTFSSPSGNYFGLFRPSLGTPSGVGIVGRTSKIADMQVPEVFQIMLGKKGQLADGIAEIIHAIVTGQQTLPGSDSLQALPTGQLLLAGGDPAGSQAPSLAAGEVRAAGLFRAERVARRVAGAAMAEAFGEIGAAVPLLVARRLVAVGAGLQEQQVPAGHQLALVEGERQLVGRRFAVHRRLAHQVGVQGLQVFVASPGEGGVRERRIQVAAVAGHAMPHGPLEGGVGPATDAARAIRREVAAVDRPERRRQGPSAGVARAAFASVADRAVAEGGEAFAAGDLLGAEGTGCAFQWRDGRLPGVAEGDGGERDEAAGGPEADACCLLHLSVIHCAGRRGAPGKRIRPARCAAPRVRVPE